ERQRFLLHRDPDEVVAPVWLVEPYAGLAVGSRLEGWTEARYTVAIPVGMPDHLVLTGFGPRGGLRMRIGGGLSARAGVGRVYAPPTPPLWLGGDAGASPQLEQSDQVAVGAAWARGEIHAAGDGYVRTTADLAEIEYD